MPLPCFFQSLAMAAFFTPLFLCQKLLFFFHAVAVFLRPLFRFLRLKVDGTGLPNKNEKEITTFLEEEPESIPPPPEKNDGEEETEGMYLKFRFPTYQEFTGDINYSNGGFNTDGATAPEFEFASGKGEEINADPFNNKACLAILSEDSMEEFSQTGGVSENIDSKMEFTENELTDDTNSAVTGSDSDSSVSNKDGFLSGGDFEGGLNINKENDNENESSETDSELSGFEVLEEDFSDEDSDVMEELKKLENPGVFLSDRDFNDDFDGGDQLEKPRSKEDSPEDENELESLWEHQELIEQLKMELKKVRATGLPTILEESESPKLMDDLKPWKIDEFKREDCLGELHKFYKSYREKMRKFDIINYQKMYAMGFLQLKDPLKSAPNEKPSAPTLKSVVSRNLWLFRNKIHGTDPMKRFVQELQGDLEGVYVGQMCLSWEFLHWQYERALDMWDSDRRGAIRRYNEVAGEFQQFQVLIQRFIEDEPYQGPRVQNYVKTRCAVRNLLQVPVIKEDNMKGKRKIRAKGEDDYTITSDELVETVEESIRVFWRFVRADKDCATPTTNARKPELAGPEDLELLMEIKKNLQKKERKIKDILRSENCILRRFRQCREDDSDDQVLYFFSQVDMRLVGRVLNMSKVTNEQLVWCRNKLNRIRFVHRRIHVEPAFLLFPC